MESGASISFEEDVDFFLSRSKGVRNSPGKGAPALSLIFRMWGRVAFTFLVSRPSAAYGLNYQSDKLTPVVESDTFLQWFSIGSCKQSHKLVEYGHILIVIWSGWRSVV